MDKPHYSLSPAHRQEIVRKIVVEHDRYKQAFEGLSHFHYPVRGGLPAAGSLAMLVGDSRAGKTFVCGRYAASHQPRVGEAGMEMPVVRVDMPVEYSGSARSVLTGIADAIDFPAPAKISIEALSVLVLKTLKQRRVELLVLDEFEQLFHAKNRRMAGFGKGLLRKILNLGTLSVVCVGLTETYDYLKDDEQLVGRGGLPYRLLSPYDWNKKDDQLHFRAICDAFDRQLPFEELSGLGRMDLASRLFWVSEGNIGKLKWLIEAAAAVALNDDALSIDAKHFAQAYEDRMPIGTHLNPFRHDLSQMVRPGGKSGRIKSGSATQVFAKASTPDLRDGV